MPVSQIMLPDIEADDTIAYACQLTGAEKENKSLSSLAIKIFFSFLMMKLSYIRPIQKEFLNKNSIIDKFGIHPNNMTIARAMAGDKSDNLEGIGGCGLTTVSKRFPFLKEEKSYTITEVLQHSKEMLSERKLKVYENLLNKQETFERNYKIMQLYAPSISVTGKHTIRDSVLNSDLSLNKTAIRKMMIEDGFVDYNWSSLFQSLNRVCFTE
jgi:5'-3' exonuclease